MATIHKWVTKTGSQVDQAAKLLKIYCVVNDIRPSETGILVCAYVLIYGFNEKVKELILKSGVLNTEASLRNELYSLKKLGLLEGKYKAVRISSKISANPAQALTPQTVLFINLDNR